jgi:hypothetical protein
MDLRDLFTLTDYTFLTLASGAGGNKVVSETPAQGVIKFRDGMVQEGGREAHTSQATIHILPDEPFIAAVGGHQSLVGHGIRAEGTDYRIEGVKVGTDFEDGSIAFYLCTLKREALWQSALPLE